MAWLALWPFLAWAQASTQAPVPASRPSPSKIEVPSRAQPAEASHAKATSNITEQPRAPSSQPPHAPSRARSSSSIEAQPRAQPLALEPARAQSHVKAPTKIETQPNAQPSSRLDARPDAKTPATIEAQHRAHPRGLSHAKPYATTPAKIVGTVWQPDQEHTRPVGNWQKLGARSLLVQWSRAGDVAFIAGCGGQPAAVPPDWKRIASEPWAKEVIMGLAGDYSETTTRQLLPELIQRSRCLAQLNWPIHINAWYFPAEIDPTWKQAAQLRSLLTQLPRPLWVSAYDSVNLGPSGLCSVLKDSLPDDVGIFFQDGVGVHARTAGVSHDYLQGLRKCLGPHHKVRLIAEVMRPLPEGGFRAVTTQEMRAQLAMYPGEKVWLFEGPHYLNADLVDAIASELQKK